MKNRESKPPRSVSSKDFSYVYENMDIHARKGKWHVCDSYRIENGEIVAEYPVFRPPFANPRDLDKHEDHLRHWRDYSPLEGEHNLLLSVVRLSEEKNFQQAALEFSREYGLLGESDPDFINDPIRLDLRAFRREARKIGLILNLYESVLRRNGEWAFHLVNQFDIEIYGSDPRIQGAPVSWFSDPPPGFERLYPDDDNLESCALALDIVLFELENTIQALCRPCLIRSRDDDFLDMSTLRQGWEFENLLGAVYLQAYWLVTAGRHIKRCRNCGGIVVPDPQKGAKRRVRSDKTYCGGACRQARYRERKAGNVSKQR